MVVPHILFADDDRDIRELVLAGAHGYLGKPFTAKDLIAALRSCFKASEVLTRNE